MKVGNQYITIFNRVSVCVYRKWDVRGAGLDYSDVRPSYYDLLNLELCVECSRIVDMAGICWRGAAAEADTIG